MTERKQKALVREISKNVVRSICEKIDSGAIPAEWDGHEFRCLLAVRHHESADVGSIMRDKRSRRYREFANLVLIRNL